MSGSDSKYADLQATDRYSPDEVVKRVAKKGLQNQQATQQLEHESVVRQLVMQLRKAFEGDGIHDAENLLLAAHWHLRQADSLPDLLHPADDRLDRETKLDFREQCRLRDQGKQPPSPSTEFVTLAKIAEALDYISAIMDPSRYAPVRFDSIDEPGARTTTDQPTPIGRIRIGHDSAKALDDRAVELPHQSCDHIGAVALPRRGKDSTLVSAGMNLHAEHGYKYISIMDDGRMETPMVAIPNDEDVIQQNLKRMGQEPTAMAADVYVPAMSGVPEMLPGNFKQFTIGIDSLTPHLILRLAGVTKSDETVEARIKKALDETLDGTGNVSELVSRLEVYSREMEATIEWTEQEEKSPGKATTETYTARYQMDAEDALEKAAQRLGQLAAEGLIASPSASTNLDMKGIIRNRERAAVLCCNFLDSGLEPLKYVIMDLWLRLIYQARDQNPRLPRVCIEVRELKNIAPSKLADVRYKDDIKTLRQTIFFLTTQGGSRRILLLGSTQKWNDVYKPVRSNIAIKILLQLGDDEIDTLDQTHHFSYEQQDQLAEFSIGQGMLLAEGGAHWPIELRGAPCGLGLGDRHWRDRYGVAWGARVREHERDSWRGPNSNLPGWWVDVARLDIAQIDEVADKPDIGTWFLLPSDLDGVDCEAADTYDRDADRFEEATAEEQREWVDAALEARREHDIPNDLLLRPTGTGHRQRSVTLGADDADAAIQDLVEEHGIPGPVQSWLSTRKDTRENLITAVETLDENGPYKYAKDIAEDVPYAKSTFKNYWSDDSKLEECWKKDGKSYRISPIGKQAASLDWDKIESQLQEVDA
ncbi:hypothetical protein [Haloarcula amylovorans]|uniref:hypothetical protein n=1 Tax=Haloarcula amylovorans TaxID=2562280 RepID=UPI001075F3C3|nr:hypothetical protein [Halomicroarcula amylolytica]